MTKEITIKFGTELKLTQHNWKSQLYTTFFLLKKKNHILFYKYIA